jgi:Fur family transcriptional regulator, ferric uptake regulator
MARKKIVKPSSTSSRLQVLSDQLRGSGLRRTGPRIAVLERLAVAQSPLSHGDICGELELLGFDRATVYRNLMDLTEAGLVSRTDLGDHVWRFELRQGGEGQPHKHPHLVCVDCGEVSCLTDVQVQITTMRGSKRSMRESELEVQLRGRCERCEA